MPEERGYTRQTRPQAGAPLPQVSAESYGAGFGRAVGDFAEQQHRQNLRGYQIQRQRTADAERSTAFERLTDWRARIAEQRREREANAAAGADGHLAAIEELLVEDDQEPLFEGITETGVQQWLRGQLTSAAAAERERAQDFATIKGVEKTVSDGQQGLERLVNAAGSSDDPNAWAAAHEQWTSYVEGLTGLDGNKRVEMLRGGQAAIDVGKAKAIMQEDPASLIAFLAGGMFDETLSPQQIDRLRDEAQNELRSLEVAARTAAAHQEKALREQVNTLLELNRQGVTIDDAQLAAAQAAVAGLGDSSLAAQIEGIRSSNAFSKVYEQATPVQREQRLAELQSMGDKRGAAEDRELKWLEDHQSALDSSFNSDPAGFYTRTATPPPALDFTDPASVAARSRWASAASAASGRIVPPLTRNEAADLRERYRTGGRAGAVEVLDALGQLPPDQAAAAARMVDPQDAVLPVMAALPREYRQLALDGRETIRAKPGLFKDAIRDDGDLEESIGDFDRRFDDALRAVPPAQRQAILATGARIAAGLIDQNGGTLTAEIYWKAMNMALGATGTGADRKGGLGRWGDNWFVLPDGVSGEAFGSAVQRAARDGTSKPVNPDGSPATLSRAFPVAVGNGLYEFRTRSGAVVKGSNGEPWRVRVRSAAR